MIDLVVIPVLTGYERAARIVDSLFSSQTREPRKVCVVNNGLSEFECLSLRSMASRVIVHRKPEGGNYGVAASWNIGLNYAANFMREAATVLVLNDDVVLAPHTLQAYSETLETAPDDVVIVGLVEYPYSAWACRANRLLEDVGPFDEAFWPAYFEDNDMAYRIALAGLRELFIDNEVLGVSHPTVATTSRELGDEGARWLSERYRVNREHYDAKWGAQPPHELYTRPFDVSSINIEAGGYNQLRRRTSAK